MYYIEINPAVLWIFGILLLGVAVLLGFVLYNQSEIQYRLSMILARENRRQSNLHSEWTRAGVQPTPRRY